MCACVRVCVCTSESYQSLNNTILLLFLTLLVDAGTSFHIVFEFELSTAAACVVVIYSGKLRVNVSL